MEKIYRNYVWADQDLFMPMLVRARHIYLEKEDRPLNKLRVELPYWVLDCSFGPAFSYKVEAPRGEWKTRKADTLHLYPARCVFWESDRLGKVRHSAFIMFKNGELAGLNALIDRRYNHMRIVDSQHKISRYLIEIAEIGYRQQEGGFWQAQTLLFKVISLLHRCKHQEAASFVLESDETTAELTLAQRVDQYLFAHLKESITRAGLAKHFNVSVSTLSHVYKTQTGISPMRQLLCFRMDLAAHMLEQGETLGVIAEHTGFSSPFHLSAMFKKTRGISPREYRRNYRTGSVNRTV